MLVLFTPVLPPQEIEEGIVIKVEEALKDVTEIKKVVSTSSRVVGNVSLEIFPEEELTDVLDKVKLRVDGIATFPADMEPVNVAQAEFQQDVIQMSIVGDVATHRTETCSQKSLKMNCCSEQCGHW